MGKDYVKSNWRRLRWIIDTFEKLLNILLYNDKLLEFKKIYNYYKITLLQSYFKNIIYNYYFNNNRCISIVVKSKYRLCRDKLCGNKLKKKFNKTKKLCGKHINKY